VIGSADSAFYPPLMRNHLSEDTFTKSLRIMLESAKRFNLLQLKDLRNKNFKGLKLSQTVENEGIGFNEKDLSAGYQQLPKQGVLVTMDIKNQEKNEIKMVDIID